MLCSSPHPMGKFFASTTGVDVFSLWPARAPPLLASSLPIGAIRPPRSPSARANVKVVQRMLGHASAAMTLDVYSGLFDDDLDVVALAMDALVPQTRHNEDSLAVDEHGGSEAETG